KCSIAFSPDGKLLAWSSTDPKIRVIEVATGQDVFSRDVPDEYYLKVAFSPDGKTLAYGGGGRSSSAIHLLDVATRSLVREWKAQYTSGLAYSPDGKTLAAVGYDCQLRLWDTATGEPIVQTEGHTNAVTAIAFSEDGQSVASAST